MVVLHLPVPENREEKPEPHRPGTDKTDDADYRDVSRIHALREPAQSGCGKSALNLGTIGLMKSV